MHLLLHLYSLELLCLHNLQQTCTPGKKNKNKKAFCTGLYKLFFFLTGELHLTWRTSIFNNNVHFLLYMQTQYECVYFKNCT